VGAVAVVFTTVTAAIMTYRYARTGFGKPPWSGDIARLQARYDKGDTVAATREALRRMDAELRVGYFRLRAFYARGSWLLAAGAVVAALCFRILRDTTPIRPMVPKRGGDLGAAQHACTLRARLALLIVAACLLGVLLLAWGVGAAIKAPTALEAITRGE